MLNKILDLLSDKRLAGLLLCVATAIAKRTDNTFDDKLVKALRLAVKNEDYGLQNGCTDQAWKNRWLSS